MNTNHVKIVMRIKSAGGCNANPAHGRATKKCDCSKK